METLNIHQVRNMILGLVLVTLTACPKPKSTTVTPSEAKFSIDKQTLDFGKVESQITFQVKNDGEASLSWTTSTSAAWLSISPASGDVAANTTTTVTISVDRSKLNDGDNSTTVTVNATQEEAALEGSPATITVTAKK